MTLSVKLGSGIFPQLKTLQKHMIAMEHEFWEVIIL